MQQVTYVLQQLFTDDEWWDICEYSEIERIKEICESRRVNFPGEKRRIVKRTVTEEVVK